MEAQGTEDCQAEGRWSRIRKAYVTSSCCFPSLDSVPLFNSTKNQRVKFAFRTAPQFPVPSYDYMKMFASARRLVFDGEDGQIKRPSLQDLKLPYMDEPCVSSSVRLSPNWYTDLYVGVERNLSRDRIRADLKTYNLEGNSASIHLIGLSGEAWVVGRLLGSVAACYRVWVGGVKEANVPFCE